MKGRLFEFAILYHPKPTEEEAKLGKTPKSEVLKTPTTMLASSDEQASILAARLIPEEYLDRLDDIEILIRPFA